MKYQKKKQTKELLKPLSFTAQSATLILHLKVAGIPVCVCLCVCARTGYDAYCTIVHGIHYNVSTPWIFSSNANDESQTKACRE